MPGHSVPESEKENVKKTAEQLRQLVLSHDITFVLMDSRESRWLPTLYGYLQFKLAYFCVIFALNYQLPRNTNFRFRACYNKPVINVGLGFDSYVVIRHGVDNFKKNSDQRLGCYFCNDVVAPQNVWEILKRSFTFEFLRFEDENKKNKKKKESQRSNTWSTMHRNKTRVVLFGFSFCSWACCQLFAPSNEVKTKLKIHF